MSLMVTCTLKSRLTQMMFALPRLICAQIELSPCQPAAPTCSLPRGCCPPAAALAVEGERGAMALNLVGGTAAAKSFFKQKII